MARDEDERGGAKLEMRAVAGVDWMAIRSAAASRALASTGLLQDVEVGDPGLDRELHFVARDPGSLRGAIGTEAPRAALAGLLGEPAFSSILVRADLVRVQWMPRRRGADEDPGVVARRIRESLALLGAIGCGPGAPR